MADYAKIRADDAVQELEQMEKIQLFDKSQIRVITKKRKEFESKIQRRTKCKEDFIRYIQYELDLLKAIRGRKDISSASVIIGDIEQSITNRVDTLFKHVIHRFQADVRLWTYYIKFCKQVGLITNASAILVKMVAVHGDKANVWKMAANWHFEECNSIENSRKYLIRGLQLHPDSKALYEEAFRQELQFAYKKRKQKAEEVDSAATSLLVAPPGTIPIEPPDKITEGRLAEVIYESSIHKVDNVQFYVDLLSIAKEYDFTEKLQNNIVNHLLSKYRNDELAWDTMARRELEGFTYQAQLADSNSSTSGPSLPSSDKKKQSLKTRINFCVTVYYAVVKQLNTERMWSFFLETLIELNQDLVNLPTYKQNLLKGAFQEAHAVGRLQEKYYLQWVDLLQSTSKFNKLGLVLRQASERFSSNIELWQMRLRFHLARDEESLGISVFEQAVVKLGTDNEGTLPLWKNLIQYYQTKDVDKSMKVFEKGIKLGTTISNSLKPLFLEWLLLMKGLSKVHQEYEFLSMQSPPCLELHLKMIALESMQPEMNIKLMRKCYEAACLQFGRENSDVWMDYAKFELDNGEASNVTSIHARAINTLDSLQADMFVSEFARIQQGLPTPMATHE